METNVQNNKGLSSAEVLVQQKKYGRNTIHTNQISISTIFYRQFSTNPLLIILITATVFSYLLGQQISAFYIGGIISVSILLGLWNEYSAQKTVEKLLKKISQVVVVYRNGEKTEIEIEDLTIGDIVVLTQGSLIPAEITLVTTKHLEINESALTGESQPVAKNADDTTNNKNIAFMGTDVTNGYGIGKVTAIGQNTQYGKIAKSTTFLKPETEFQKGLGKFGSFIIKVVIILTIAMFFLNFLVGHSFIISLLFSLAIAVGLTPELLPVIVTVSLSHGAGKLAKKNVITKQLLAIENIGNMDILCTDKTGTLTEGSIAVVDFITPDGKKDTKILEYALLCNSISAHHIKSGNAIDIALWKYVKNNDITIPKTLEKIDDEPFDYDKRAMFCVVDGNTSPFLIVKGAPETILSFCKPTHKKDAEKLSHEINEKGYRVIAIASKSVHKKSYDWDDCHGAELLGFITFQDIPKKTAKDSLDRLARLHVGVKVITGDNEIIATSICEQVGLPVTSAVSGDEIEKLSEEKRKERVKTANLFTRVSPSQKVLIIQTLQKEGFTIGYLGDGINDIPALHIADVGISVNTAIDVAKDAASVVLLQKSLHVLADGIVEGRKTFNNTIKYILMSTSSNFGNMFSAAISSVMFSFLPMTPVQILLTNGLYDISQLSIPSDNVDHESLIRPRHWNINFIKNYMLFFGPLSSLFDFLTFGIMLFFFHARGQLFQTGWFIESLATEILVVFVIRTAASPFFKSKPSIWLTITSLSVVSIGALLPFSPLAPSLGLVVPPPSYFIVLICLVVLYLTMVEIVKKVFLSRFTL